MDTAVAGKEVVYSLGPYKQEALPCGARPHREAPGWSREQGDPVWVGVRCGQELVLWFPQEGSGEAG